METIDRTYLSNVVAPETYAVHHALAIPQLLESVSDSAVIEEFYKLAGQWKTETQFYSSPSRIKDSEFYDELKGMGQKIIPLIIAELKNRETPAYWFPMLIEISGENPVPPHSAGDVSSMVNSWTEWAQNKVFL